MTSATRSPNDNGHYIGILEAVVALLCLNSGVNPNSLMANVLTDLSKQAGIETAKTDALIQARWANRQLSAVRDVASKAQAVANCSLENNRATVAAPAVAGMTLEQRAADWKARRDAQKAAETPQSDAQTNANPVQTGQNSPTPQTTVNESDATVTTTATS